MGSLARAWVRGTSRIALSLITLVAGTALIPGSAVGPAGEAHASIEDFLTTPPPAIAAVIPFEPVFAKSLEEREIQRWEASREDAAARLRFGAVELPRGLVRTILRAAAATEVDPAYLMALADKESSFRTEIRASTSSAEGLFQFIDTTWLAMVRDYGPRHGLDMEADAITEAGGRLAVADAGMRTRILELRRDPYLAAVMAAELMKRDGALIGFRIGRRLTTAEMYIAHFLGLEDAGRFIELRGAAKPPMAAAIFPAAARANVPIFYEAQGRRRRGLTVPEVYAKIGGAMEARVERYRDVERTATADAAN